MLKNVERTPHGGFTLSTFGAHDGGTVTRRGRPESETDTPVNIGNGPYRDNGEGVAETPLPYPLETSPDCAVEHAADLSVDGA